MLAFVAPALVFGQAVHYESDVSVRNRTLGHYHKMVTWDDSQYKEFAYYETSQYGTVMDFMNWRAIFPAGFDKNNTSKKYPAIVMLHGAGESGRKWTGRFQYEPSDPRYDNNGHHLLHGGREHRDAVNRSASNPRAFPGIVIFPQVSYNGVWTGDNITMASLIIEYMIEEYNIDPYRIYVHGLSNGGKGVWEFATQRPDLFAAGLPMSGVGTNRDAMTDSLVTMPLWIFQGETDTNPSPGWSVQWYQALQQKGGKPRYTLYEGVGHGTWTYAYAESDFFSWMLSQDKRQIFFFSESIYTPTEANPLKLGFSAGFLEYQWTRNGVNIPGATGRYYTATQGGVYRVKFKQKINNQWAESFPLDLGEGGPCTDCPVAEVVNIPDVNFKAALVNNPGVNTNGDDEIQLTEAEAESSLDVSGKNIASLTGIEAFVNLTSLDCSDNNLSVLNLSENTQLSEIFAANNDIETLVLPASPLISLNVQNNSLGSLSTAGIPNLENLDVSGNDLTSLDVSSNLTLFTLDVRNNNLAYLNVQNGHNDQMHTFEATGNPNLECVQVDDAESSNSEWSNKVDTGVVFSTDCSGSSGDVVFIPDLNLKAALVGNASVNINGDAEIQVTEAAAFTGQINLIGSGISNMTGIEAFTALTDLRVHNNNLTSLNVSANTQLKELHFQGNNITSIDLSNNTLLVKVRGQNNALSSLDVSALGALRYLEVQNNALTALNVQNGNNHNMYKFDANGNPDLGCVQVDNVVNAQASWSGYVGSGVVFSLDCGGGTEPVVYIPDANFKALLLADAGINTNGDDEIQVAEAQAENDLHLASAGISDLTGVEAFVNLDYLDVSGNNLTNLDLSANGDLDELVASANQLHTLVLPNSNMITIDVSGNQLTSLDVSTFYNLENLFCSNNSITVLDLSANGTLYALDCRNNDLAALNVQNGHNVEMHTFEATGNPDLECVQVDDVAHAETIWSGNVDAGVVFSTDCSGGTGDPVVFIPDANLKAALVGNTAVNTNGDTEIQVSEAEAVTGQINLIGQGISDLTGMEAFTALTDLRVHYNNLTTLDLSANTQLRELHFQNNQVSSVDLSNNPLLEKVRAQNNALTSLDVNELGNLRYLEVQNNALVTLNLKNGNNFRMYSFNATGNPSLSCVEVDNVSDAETRWSAAVDPGVGFSTDCAGGSGARFAASPGGVQGVADQAGIFALSLVGQPSAYPNPFVDEVLVSLPEGTVPDQAMILYDYAGRLIRTAGYTSGGSSETLNLSDVRGGIYILRVGEYNIRLLKKD